MKCKTYILALGFILNICLPCASAMASSYIGFGAGNASNSLKPLFGTRELEDSAMLKGLIGIRTDNHAVEFDLSLGNFEWVNSPSDSHTVLNVSASIVGFIPLGDTFELFGKLGANLSSTAVDYQGSVYEGDTGIGLAYGGGVNLNITEGFALRAEYQGITGVDDGVDSGDIKLVSVQAIINF